MNLNSPALVAFLLTELYGYEACAMHGSSELVRLQKECKLLERKGNSATRLEMCKLAIDDLAAYLDHISLLAPYVIWSTLPKPHPIDLQQRIIPENSAQFSSQDINVKRLHNRRDC
jgi:hypothetical protein